jgi:hypothetical protein
MPSGVSRRISTSRTDAGDHQAGPAVVHRGRSKLIPEQGPAPRFAAVHDDHPPLPALCTRALTRELSSKHFTVTAGPLKRSTPPKSCQGSTRAARSGCRVREIRGSEQRLSHSQPVLRVVHAGHPCGAGNRAGMPSQRGSTTFGIETRRRDLALVEVALSAAAGQGALRDPGGAGQLPATEQDSRSASCSRRPRPARPRARSASMSQDRFRDLDADSPPRPRRQCPAPMACRLRRRLACSARAVCPADLRDHRAHGRAAVTTQLAPHEVRGLDAVGTLVDRRDPHIAPDTARRRFPRHSPCRRGPAPPGMSAPRRHSVIQPLITGIMRSMRACSAPRSIRGAVVRQIHGHRLAVGQGAHRFDQGAHGQQHALDVRRAG